MRCLDQHSEAQHQVNSHPVLSQAQFGNLLLPCALFSGLYSSNPSVVPFPLGRGPCVILVCSPQSLTLNVNPGS